MLKHLIWRIGMVSLKRSQVVTTQKTQLVEVNIGFRQRCSSFLVVRGQNSVKAIRHLEGSAYTPGDDGQVVRRISHTAVLPVDHSHGPLRLLRIDEDVLPKEIAVKKGRGHVFREISLHEGEGIVRQGLPGDRSKLFNTRSCVLPPSCVSGNEAVYISGVNRVNLSCRPPDDLRWSNSRLRTGEEDKRYASHKLTNQHRSLRFQNHRAEPRNPKIQVQTVESVEKGRFPLNPFEQIFRSIRSRNQSNEVSPQLSRLGRAPDLRKKDIAVQTLTDPLHPTYLDLRFRSKLVDGGCSQYFLGASPALLPIVHDIGLPELVDRQTEGKGKRCQKVPGTELRIYALRALR